MPPSARWQRGPLRVVKVPATPEGIPAIEQLISEGINVNVTLLFSVERYRAVIEEPTTVHSVRMDFLDGDGVPRPLEINVLAKVEDGAIVGINGVARDISERIRLERELSQSEERFRYLVQNSPDIVFSTDAEGRFTFVSKAIERVTGHQAEDMIGQHFSVLIDRSSGPVAGNRWEALVADPDQEQQADLVLIGPDGRRVPVDVRALGVTDAEGRFAGIQGATRDVSDQVRLESELRRQAGELAAGEERAHLARELHDELGQMLTALRMDAAWLGKACSTQPEKLGESDFLCGDDENFREYAHYLQAGSVVSWLLGEGSRGKCKGAAQAYLTALVQTTQDRRQKTASTSAIRLTSAETAISGNGTRCVAAYLYLTQGWDRPSVRIATGAGLKSLKPVEKRDRGFVFETEMGVPRLRSEDIPVVLSSPLERVIRQKIDVDGRALEFTSVSMGNPHCSVFVDDFDRFDWRELGARIEKHRAFPEHTNVEFIRVLNPGEIEVRFWERGCGETLASGTGACAAALASMLNELTDRKVGIVTAAGEILVEWREDGTVVQTGEACAVYRGDWP